LLGGGEIAFIYILFFYEREKDKKGYPAIKDKTKNAKMSKHRRNEKAISDIMISKIG